MAALVTKSDGISSQNSEELQEVRVCIPKYCKELSLYLLRSMAVGRHEDALKLISAQHLRIRENPVLLKIRMLIEREKWASPKRGFLHDFYLSLESDAGEFLGEPEDSIGQAMWTLVQKFPEANNLIFLIQFHSILGKECASLISWVKQKIDKNFLWQVQVLDLVLRWEKNKIPSEEVVSIDLEPLTFADSNSKKKLLRERSRNSGYIFLYDLFGKKEIVGKLLHSFSMDNCCWQEMKQRIFFLARQGSLIACQDNLSEVRDVFNTTGDYWVHLSQLFRGETPFEIVQICDCLLRLVEIKKWDQESVEKLLESQKLSGELLCELARFMMNPTAMRPDPNDPLYIPYDLDLAEQLLKQATEVTSQYGDSFVELIKLYIVRYEIACDKNLTEEALGYKNKLQDLKVLFFKSNVKYGLLFAQCCDLFFLDKEATWKRMVARVNMHLEYLGESPEDVRGLKATNFEEYGSAFGMRLSNIQNFGEEHFPKRVWLQMLLCVYNLYF